MLDVDDIECDLDEDLDDERCSVAQAGEPTVGQYTGTAAERRQSNMINESFITSRLRDFSNIKARNLVP